MKKSYSVVLLLALVASLLISGCTKGTTSIKTPAASGSVSSGAIVASEQAPAGDIPDSQTFIAYASSAGKYQMQVPEGWARTEKGTNVTFIKNYDGVKVEVTAAGYTLSADNIKNNYVAALMKNGYSVTVKSVQEVKLKNLTAVKVSYTSNSDPDPVTQKQTQLENDCYCVIQNGKLAVMTLWAPNGSDNADQWKLMSDSFTWSK